MILSRRTVLTPVGVHDAGDIIALHRDPRVVAQLIDGIPDEPWKVSIYLDWAAKLHARGIGPWAARRQGDGRFLGLYTLTPFNDGDDDLLEFGGRLARAAWPGGLSVEAGAALIDHAFEGLGRRELVSAHHPDNRAAAAALARLGFGNPAPETVFGRSAIVHRLDVATWRALGGRALPPSRGGGRMGEAR
ncbi:GNAT family N-acetyltransferase [Glacieibacterium frigidum]|uniref:GNAT family N-acetyltransferase n=1 Tax=Glacieibacterium frigidum TaxID=2593303 RepID=UPI00163D8219|nr:GNAT family N-acetyltransferase [Glacieibacterium frigidum]